jgi:hypothetical protein
VVCRFGIVVADKIKIVTGESAFAVGRGVIKLFAASKGAGDEGVLANGPNVWEIGF